MTFDIAVKGHVSKVVCYQLDFVTPGSKPALANSLKSIRHKPNFLKYPFFRPHIKHLFTIRLENLGLLFDLAIVDFLGMFLRFTQSNSKIKNQISKQTS
ncbi:MAG: hypothetical protein A2750_00855 [Candidatus Yanofskybacteria bacterium RIFCSPHIGHO2_01_FULL_45_42]|uniref:Uncharacterized protein n=1 Tax=Candidatus Yanofskybacteria bacterium RIFCSPHIGHO2_01_FULL_45_42 TaxID=1802671 RepID=A0A1F8F5D2_9BACT|nr:MAG: hypothetical protein A2750_00855 [Candidatus Yanofskybacteria bacterium RIFCSPHIGHO2_01_FULL_45_42]